MNYLTIAKYVGGVLLGLGLAWSIYAGIIRPTTKPNPTTTQAATTIVNHNSSPKATFGCTSVKVYEYYKEKEVQ
jgi:hypothetical protein